MLTRTPTAGIRGAHDETRSVRLSSYLFVMTNFSRSLGVSHTFTSLEEQDVKMQLALRLPFKIVPYAAMSVDKIWGEAY